MMSNKVYEIAVKEIRGTSFFNVTTLQKYKELYLESLLPLGVKNVDLSRSPTLFDFKTSSGLSHLALNIGDHEDLIEAQVLTHSKTFFIRGSSIDALSVNIKNLCLYGNNISDIKIRKGGSYLLSSLINKNAIGENHLSGIKISSGFTDTQSLINNSLYARIDNKLNLTREFIMKGDFKILLQSRDGRCFVGYDYIFKNDRVWESLLKGNIFIGKNLVSNYDELHMYFEFMKLANDRLDILSRKVLLGEKGFIVEKEYLLKI